LFFIDINSDKLDSTRKALSFITSNIQRIVDWPIKGVGYIFQNISNYQDVIKENTKLRKEIILLNNNINKIVALKNENKQLRALLQSSANLTNTKMLIGQLLAISGEPYVNKFTIDKGSKDTVYKGQVVVDANGVVGLVSHLGYYTSDILLITDKRSMVPVQNIRNNMRSIIVGNGSNGKMSLINVPVNSDILPGDSYITSGLGKKYPYGYPVGIVSTIDRSQGNGFANIELLPTANLNRSRLVLFLTTNDAHSVLKNKK